MQPYITNIKKAITNNCNLVDINQELKDVFQEQPISAFSRNRNLHDLLRCQNIVDRKLQSLSQKKDFPISVLEIRKLMM